MLLNHPFQLSTPEKPSNPTKNVHTVRHKTITRGCTPKIIRGASLKNAKIKNNRMHMIEEINDPIFICFFTLKFLISLKLANLNTPLLKTTIGP